ncbi:RHS repeat-associated core domain-containing protein, partial [Alkaliphilus serpentinus]
GNEKNPDSNDTNVFRYSGEYFDKETGTIYLRARYYDPRLGRFISEDSYKGNNNDPLSLNFISIAMVILFY